MATSAFLFASLEDSTLLVENTIARYRYSSRWTLSDWRQGGEWVVAEHEHAITLVVGGVI
jgi:hypothetical protein